MGENRCVCCGEIIPEGRQVCPSCAEGMVENKKKPDPFPVPWVCVFFKCFNLLPENAKMFPKKAKEVKVLTVLRDSNNTFRFKTMNRREDIYGNWVWAGEQNSEVVAWAFLPSSNWGKENFLQ